LGVIMERISTKDEALNAFNSALGIMPLHYHANLNKARILRALSRWDEALGCCAIASQIRPDLPDPWLEKGNAAAHLAKYHDALHNWDEALRQDPRCSAAWFNKGIIQRDCLQDRTAAIICFERALALGWADAAQEL